MTSNPHPTLHGKTIFITGASSGIGRSTALEFARSSPSSLKLILAARRIDALTTLSSQIKKEVGEGVKTYELKLDVSKREEVERVLGMLPEGWREVDLLVNNAGLALGGLSGAPNLNSLHTSQMFLTNVHGLITLTQVLLPSMLSRNTGTIIMLNSIAGREPYPGGSIYCATKAAVRAFTDSLRRELVVSGKKVRVMEVAPGQVETEFSVVRFGGTEGAREVYRGCEPLTPEDIAEVIVFMASRRENVVVADVLLYPNHQASATVLHRKP